MKTTPCIGLKQTFKTRTKGMLTLGILLLFAMPTLTLAGSNLQSGMHHGMSYLAEKEIRANEQKASAKEEKGDVKIIANTDFSIQEETEQLNETHEATEKEK